MRAATPATERGAVPLIEEGGQLLRNLPFSVLATYAVGTLPFTLGLLFFWSDMSRSALAPRHCSAGALGLGLLFIWMKCWQTVFCRQIAYRLMRQVPPAWTLSRLARIAARQGVLHASGFILLPLAILFTVPAAWGYAFYQNVTALDDGGPEGLATLVRRAWRQTVLWPKQNHLMLLVLGAFGLFVFFNGALFLALAPSLLKRFLGLDTLFTLSGAWGLFNTTFLAVSVALAHVCLDPLIKTLYTLRCFYGRSLRTGEDLRARLVGLRRTAAGLVLLTLLLAGFTVQRVDAAGGGALEVAASETATGIQAEDLDAAVRDVLAQPRYTWRLPREQAVVAKETQNGWLASFFDWLKEVVRTTMQPIARGLERIWEWLWERELESRPPEAKRSLWPYRVKGLLVLAGVALVALVAAAIHHRYRPKTKDTDRPSAVPVTTVPDLSDDRVRADALPTDEWLQLAQRLAAEGRFRQAMRACFFSTMGVLANQHLIMLADHKSNREYEREVMRRASDRPALGAAFKWSVDRLDRAWYGMRTIKREDFIRFAAQQQEIAARAQG